LFVEVHTQHNAQDMTRIDFNFIPSPNLQIDNEQQGGIDYEKQSASLKTIDGS